MATAPDGSPVEIYRRLPERGEGALVAEAIAPPAGLLELGCGTGRVTRQLKRLGFDVVAVDESPEMLAHVGDAESVCARIEGLDLARRFDAVLLLSNLLTVEESRRRAFLETCRRHSELLVVESLPLGWQPSETEWLRIDCVEDGVVHGEVFYDGGGSHSFAMRVFADQRELDAALTDGGFAFERWIDPARGWFAATSRRGAATASRARRAAARTRA